MNELDDILQRYLHMNGSGTKSYFDADEIADLLDYFESENDIAQYEKALDFGLKLHPENPDLKFRTCKLMIFKEQYNEALELIMETGCDSEGEFELLKIECLCASDRYDEVKRIIELKQMQQSEDVEELYEYVASVLGELTDKQSELEELLDEGLALFPDNLALKEEYCYLLEAQGLTVEALHICNELIDSDPYFPDYWYMAGRLYAEANDYDKAIEALDFAVTCDDSDMEIRIFRAFCFHKNDLLAKAITEFREIFASEQQDDTDALIQAIDAEYPVPADFKDVCFLFEVLRDEVKHKDVSSPLINKPAYQHDKNKIPAITRHFDSLADGAKQYFSSDQQRSNIHFLHADDIYAENRNISSKQLASTYLTQKYHNN
ncbi:MAG: tetratricopeptide repeat protein [Tannerella sp.]|jgi:tetratricopeptide (TPR) repeat protein|nr:tetratricopeptide repeat protein [Tannerella sp.]